MSVDLPDNILRYKRWCELFLYQYNNTCLYWREGESVNVYLRRINSPSVFSRLYRPLSLWFSPLTFIHLSYLLSLAISRSLWGSGWITHVWYQGISLKLHTHTHRLTQSLTHTSTGLFLCVCYGCVSMLCWCVQGCCGLNRLCCLLPLKHTHTVVLYIQKGHKPSRKHPQEITQLTWGWAHTHMCTHTHVCSRAHLQPTNEHTHVHRHLNTPYCRLEMFCTAHTQPSTHIPKFIGIDLLVCKVCDWGVRGKCQTDGERRGGMEECTPTVFSMDQPAPPDPRGSFIAPTPPCPSPLLPLFLCFPFFPVFCCLSVHFQIFFTPLTIVIHTSFMCFFPCLDCRHVGTAVDTDQVSQPLPLCWQIFERLVAINLV